MLFHLTPLCFDPASKAKTEEKSCVLVLILPPFEHSVIVVSGLK